MSCLLIVVQTVNVTVECSFFLRSLYLDEVMKISLGQFLVNGNYLTSASAMVWGVGGWGAFNFADMVCIHFSL